MKNTKMICHVYFEWTHPYRNRWLTAKWFFPASGSVRNKKDVNLYSWMDKDCQLTLKYMHRWFI